MGRHWGLVAACGVDQDATTAALCASEELIDLFQRKPGETQVRFRLEQARDFSVILDVPVKVRPDREFREAVEKICGAEAIEVLAS